MSSLRLAFVAGTAVFLAACSAQSTANTQTTNSDRVAALHRAAQCVRDHGIPGFTDPVLGANGQVFTDTRPLQDAPKDTQDAARSACHDLVSQADWNPEQQSPAPAALVAAGVKAAQCMRQHGLPDFRDPTAQSDFTPGHGFGMRPEYLPPGADKRTPAVQQAAEACRSLLDEENRASALDQLAGK